MINADIIENIPIVEIIVEQHAERTSNFASPNVYAGVCVLRAMQKRVFLEFAFQDMPLFADGTDFGHNINLNHFTILYPTYFANKVLKRIYSTSCNIQLNACFSLLAMIAFGEFLVATQNVQIFLVRGAEINGVW